MEPYVKIVTDFSPGLAAGVIIVIVTVVVLLRLLGFSGIGERKMADAQKSVSIGVADIKDILDGIETRLGKVEAEGKERSAEVHRLELAMTRQEGRMETGWMKVEAMYNSLTRIEDQMYAAAVRLRERGGLDV